MATLLSEYSRSFGLPDDYWSRPRPRSPVPAGNSSSKMSITQEPSFSRRRKNETQSFVKSHSVGNNDSENCKESLKDNPAMRYKAGYRRVQFAHPTVYQLDYGSWTGEDNSPLLVAQQDLPQRKPLQQRQQQDQHHVRKQRQQQELDQHQDQHRQQKNFDPQQDQHRQRQQQKHQDQEYQLNQQRGRSPVRRGNGDTTTRASPAIKKNVKVLLPKEDDKNHATTHDIDRAAVQRMQNGFAQRMGLTKPAERRRGESEEQASEKHRDRGVAKQPRRERKQRKRKQHKTAPPLTEYQRQFNKEFPASPARQQPFTPHSNPGAVLPSSTAQVTTAGTKPIIVPSRYTTIIAPSSDDPSDHWTSEYSKHYSKPPFSRLPTNKQEEPRTYRTRNRDTPLTPGPVESLPAQDDPSWFEQVLQLREKALMYKQRAEDSYLSQVISWYQDKEDDQRGLINGDRSPSSLSSSSAGTQEDDIPPTATRTTPRTPLDPPTLRSAPVESDSPSSCSDELSVEDIEDRELLDNVRYNTSQPTKPPCTCGRETRNGVPSVVQKILADTNIAITNKSVHKAHHHHDHSPFSTPMSKGSHSQVESDDQEGGVNNTHSRHHFDRTTPVKGSLLTSELESPSSLPAHQSYAPPIYPSDSMMQFRSSNPPPNPVVSRQPKSSRSGAYSRRLPVSTRITIRPSTVQVEPVHRPVNQHTVPRLNIQQSTPSPQSSSTPPLHSQYSHPQQRLPSSQAHQTRLPLSSRQQPHSQQRPPHQTGHGSECTTCGAKLRRPYAVDTQPWLGSVPQTYISTSSHHNSQYNPSQYVSAGTSRVVGQSRPVESDNVSVSSLSSCSVASQVLQRARDRRDRFWAAQHTE